MRMLSNTRLFQAAVVAAGIVAFSTTDALARSRGSWGSSGSSASYGSSSSASYASYGSSSSASYSSYGSYGSSGSSASYGSSSGGGMFARWHARKAAKHSSGSSASYGAYYASSSGSSASYGSVSYGSSGSSGSYGSTSYYSTPTDTSYETPADVPAQPEAPIETEAAIRVSVPADAMVFVNDRPTTSTGAERNFVSRGLTGGRTYAYKLRVEFTREGEQVVENKLVRLQAGQTIDLSFGAGEQVANQESAETDLTLHVPATATVTLAGAATKQTGELRTYKTDSLTPGQEWAGYVVRVELERDGKTLVEEKSLTIVGGKQYELSFDFADASAQVASLN